MKCSKLNKHTNTHIEIYLYLINLLSACEILEMTGIGVSTIGISVSSGTTDRLRLMRERLSDTEGSEGGASISSSMDPRDRLLLRRLKQEVQVQTGKVASNSYQRIARGHKKLIWHGNLHKSLEPKLLPLGH